jgi:hypothetical protein
MVSNYCPIWNDGNWHQIIIPLSDLVKPEGFDAKHVAEMQFFNTGPGDGSFFVDDMAFDNRDLEMLKNGNFENGDANWILNQTNGATGQMEPVKEGPDGKAAMRLKVLTTSDQPWRLLLYQKLPPIEKFKTYTLTFWVKSDRVGSINATCMQSHAPWDHKTQQPVTISSEWKHVQYTFEGAWDDDNARICFTNLGTTPGQVYWFANCSLMQSTEPAKVQHIVVWNGEKINKGAGWTNPTTDSIKPQTTESHSGNTALEFRFKGADTWHGAGWNWCNFKTGTNVGTDASKMKNLCFWIKSKGTGGKLQVNLLCNGDVLDTPEEHTVKVEVLTYCPKLLDGNWHEVVIPLADLNQIKGFNPKIISEIHFGFMGDKETDGSFIVDDISFDDRPLN